MTCLKKTDFPTLFLLGALCACGLFHEYLACAAGLVLIIYLFVCALRQKTMSFYLNLTSVAVGCISVGYLLTMFYATDKGAAAVGFVKFFPVLLFMLVLMQQKKAADDYLNAIPPIATAMTLLSAVLMQIPVLTRWFAVSGRLAGFFQYSNTFALFLLMAFVIVATKEKLAIIDYVYILVALFGILYSGSRTVFVLTAVALVAIVIFGKNKKNKIVFVVAAAVGIAVAVLYAVLTDNFDTIGRFLTLSLKESTFVGRFLYFFDALPVILKHPFGMGYLGYYYMQQSFQTGVYTVKFVHNDFLQLMLDIGIVPALLFVAAVVRSFLKKGGSLRKRLLLLLTTMHICFDFDLQFVAMFMLFVLLLDYKDGDEKKIRVGAVPMSVFAVLLSALFAYIGVSQSFVFFKKYDLAAKIYPWDTYAQVKILETAELNADADKRADWIIDHNEYIAAAYNKKAQIAYSKGDFKKVIEYKEKAGEMAPFSFETQQEYCYMLMNGIVLYGRNNDVYSAQVCQKALLQSVAFVQTANDRLSKLGTMIEDQPMTELPADITDYAERIADAVN